MGFWTFIFGGLAVSKAKNTLIKPHVTSKSGENEVLIIKQKGFGRNYQITYRKKGSRSTSQLSFGPGTRSIGDFEVHWL